MTREYKIEEISVREIKHADIDKFEFDVNKKYFMANLCHVGLKDGIFLYDCTITITDWCDLEVFEYNKQQRVKQFEFGLDEMPEIDQIIDFSFEDNVLTLTDFGMHNDTAIDYKFTKPKIQITGEYDPN
jgi:hypothetical protein